MSITFFSPTTKPSDLFAQTVDKMFSLRSFSCATAAFSAVFADTTEPVVREKALRDAEARSMGTVKSAASTFALGIDAAVNGMPERVSKLFTHAASGLNEVVEKIQDPLTTVGDWQELFDRFRQNAEAALKKGIDAKEEDVAWISELVKSAVEKGQEVNAEDAVKKWRVAGKAKADQEEKNFEKKNPKLMSAMKDEDIVAKETGVTLK